MNEVHLTNASIPGVRCLREMKASTNKRRRDITYNCKKIDKRAKVKYHLSWVRVIESPNKVNTDIDSIGNRKAILVRTPEETRHSIASALEGKSKNHPAQ